MAVVKVANNAVSTLASGITVGATTIALQSGDEGAFPSPTGGDWFPVTVVDGSGNLEIMQCTARSGVNLTVTRAQEGTTAYAFSAGAAVELRATAAALEDLAENIAHLNTSANVQTLLGAANYAAFRTSLDVYSTSEADSAIATAVSALVDSSPAALDTLNELAAALGDDPNFATTMTTALAGKAASTVTQGKHEIFLPAASLIPGSSNGATPTWNEHASNGHNYFTLDYDGSSDEDAYFDIRLPKSWNAGTVTFVVEWETDDTGADGVAWALQAVGVADGGAGDTAYGTPVVVTDAAQSAAQKVLITGESGALTIAGSPVAGELIQFRLFRDVSDGGDTLAADAKLRAITVIYVTDDDTDD